MDEEAAWAGSIGLKCLRQLIIERSLKRGDFVLSHGERSSIYLDLRKTTMHPEGMAFIGDLAVSVIAYFQWHTTMNPIHSVGGMTGGADPVSCAIAMAAWRHELRWRAFSVREKASSYTMGKNLDGAFERGDRVVVVEDVVTTGASAMRAVDDVRNAGGLVVGALTIVDREQGGREALRDAGVPLAALFHLRNLIT